MKKEIRKEVREYILSQVNETLARLGVSENVVETECYENKHCDTFDYKFESPAIHQMPMMFKELHVYGSMMSNELKEDNQYYKYSEQYDVVSIILRYSYKHFDGGSNGCEIGCMAFFVEKNLPDQFGGNFCKAEYYVRKIKGLEI